MTPSADAEGDHWAKLQCSLNVAGIDACLQSVWIADGDSITNQNGNTGVIANRWPDQTLAAMSLYSSYNSTTGQSPQILYFDTAIGGKTCSDRVTNAPTAVDVWRQATRKFNVVSINCGINDFKQGNTDPNSVYSIILSYVAARKAAGWGYVIVLTVEDDAIPFPQSTWETFRHSLNSLITGGASANGYLAMDVASDSLLGCDGCGSNLTYFYDTEHPTVAGYTRFVPYATAILNSIGFNHPIP